MIEGADEITKLVHSEKLYEAARYVVELCELPFQLEDANPAKFMPVLQNWLHYLLNNDGMVEAAQMLWTPGQFNPGPQFRADIWDLFDRSSMGLIMGSASTGKSFNMGVRLFLEWVRDPQWTTIKLVGPSEDHLERNLFSHIVGLHGNASLPMPGEVGQLFVGLDKRNQVSSITGTIIPIGKVKKAGRLQGSKRLPRKTPHPIFGPSSRMFIFIDEIENVPLGIWGDVDNILSLVGAEGDNGFKIFGAYNPTNREDEVGKRACPPFGWDSFDIDSHYKWKSIRGWDVLRLDGEKSENVTAGRIVYPGLQHRAGLEAIAVNSGGTKSAGYSSMGRGAYPVQGVELTLIPPGLLSRMKGEFIWTSAPTPVASADLALMGRAGAIFTIGAWGRASGMKLPPSVDNPQGLKVMFKDKNGQVAPKWALQADKQILMEKGETVKMKDQIIELCKRAGVRGRFFACDRTGIGAGIADLLRHEWSTEIHDVNYSEGASDSKLMTEDQYKCNEEYDRLATELWIALRAYAEFGYFLLNPSIDMGKLAQQLTQRKSTKSGRKTQIESKNAYIARGFESPDEADSLTLLVHAARKGSGIILSMASNKADQQQERNSDESYWFDEMGSARIDESNRSDHLDIV